LYGNAFCIVESIGGYGDATILSLMRLGYKNLYYDDPNLNKYTIQREQSTIQPSTDGKLPGFHSNAVRFQMLSHFANAVRTNEFKVRSRRVIAELDTWIFKNGRQDHQDGCHDDNITCLAMGYFVVKFYLGDMERAKERDATFLRAWIASARNIQPIQTNNKNTEISAAPKKSSYLPIYSNKTIDKAVSTIMDSYKWLFV
jgi:hypothetical protein